jgi:hypothetical protein
MYLLVKKPLFERNPKKMTVLMVSDNQKVIEDAADERNSARSYNEKWVIPDMISYCVHKRKLIEIHDYYGC